MTDTTTTTAPTISSDITEPRAWIGCLGCYNGGTLRGHWITGTAVIESTPKQCHACGAEEFEAFDWENFGGLISDGTRPSVREIQDAADFIEQHDEAKLEAFAAWLNNDSTRTLDDFDNFDELHQGNWDTIKDYAIDQANEFWPDVANSTGCGAYFDYDAYAYDLGLELEVLDLPGGGVAVILP